VTDDQVVLVILATLAALYVVVALTVCLTRE
jgi:hypothetical protein